MESVHLLLEAGAETERPCKRDRNTPIYQAALEGHLEVVRLLLEAKADPDSPNMWEDTPICEAFRSGHMEIVRLLLEARADADNRRFTRLRGIQAGRSGDRSVAAGGVRCQGQVQSDTSDASSYASSDASSDEVCDTGIS